MTAQELELPPILDDTVCIVHDQDEVRRLSEEGWTLRSVHPRELHQLRLARRLRHVHQGNDMRRFTYAPLVWKGETHAPHPTERWNEDALMERSACGLSLPRWRAPLDRPPAVVYITCARCVEVIEAFSVLEDVEAGL